MSVIVHHAADNGPPKRNRIWSELRYMRGIQKFHMDDPDRMWADIAYNYVIMPSGRVYEGRGYGVIGAHAPGHNTSGIGVCFAGNFENEDPDPRAVAAFYELVKRLEYHGANIVDVVGHGDVTATSCPGRRLRKALGL